MTTWPRDSIPALIKFYGNPGVPGAPNHAFEHDNVVDLVTPFTMYYTDRKKVSALHLIRVHRLCKEAFAAAFNEVWEACGHDQTRVNKTGASDYAGCGNLRYIAGTKRLSNHSFYCAIDLSPGSNGFYSGKGTMDPIIIAAFKRQGARWGGDYHGRTDPMHFEFVQ